jgi:acetyl esterase/lipase
MSERLVWNGFSQAELDAAYNNMAAVADSQARLDGWAARSAGLRASAGAECDQPYGPGERQRFDMFRCGQDDAPLAVFIHGGWWQRNSKDVFSCMALGPMALGCDVALLGYTLAPAARLTDIVNEIAAGLDAVMALQARLGRPASCILSGWSAGGHLTAMALGHAAVKSGVAISGVFDLEPIRRSYINDKLLLDAGEVEHLSPIRFAALPKPLLAFAGGNELPELQRQTVAFAARFDRAGAVILPGHNHFSILDEMLSATGAIAQALARAAGR